MRKPSNTSKRRPLPAWQIVGFVLAGIASVTGLAYMVYTAIHMVRSGRGFETHRTFWLVEDSWVGFLVFCASLVAALIVGFAVRIYQQRHWREFERKYGANRPDA
jgi:hypothetical protein